ncbi:hypothetical protein PMKS-002473 [Pichia membranifaciens]|uniref:Palmitoyl-protein thioesterase 1 n=1 Tax=Pichia membranifaciens TaxID=4926 RepID=A0A1Q2YHI6_9ASCO|nr:hypothetical protein PMKS-002473 [Pichia membranifaciens]
MEIWGKLLGVLLAIENASLIRGPGDTPISSIEHTAAPITTSSSGRLPVLLWHGMGDSYESASMQWVSDTLQKEHPDLDIYSIYIDRDGGKDKEASILGDAMTQRNALIKSRIYTDYIQNNIIQAQYFRNVNDYDTYLEKSAFLKYVNNELFKDLEYYDRLVTLNKFVMVMFDKDEMLVPKESAWFYDIDQETGDLISFNQTDSYSFDLIGLKKLHEDGKIDFLKIDDLHLKISENDLIYIAKTYL